MSVGQLTLQLTWACDIRCAHCSQDHVRTDLDLDVAKEAITGLLRHGEIDRLSFTGGEPFLRYKAMLELASFGARHGLNFGVVTNGRWARNADIAREKLAALQQQGLDLLVISHDEYHQAFVSDDCVSTLLEVAAELGLSSVLYVSRNDTTPISSIQQALSERFALAPSQVAVRDVVPLGHGAALPVSSLARSYFDLDRECPVRNEYNLWPDGEMLPCCSAGTHIGLSMGNLHRDSVEDIVASRRSSRLLNMLHQHDLAELVIRLPELLRLRLASMSYVSACHLCHVIVSEPGIEDLMAEIDADRIGLVDKLLHTPAVHSHLAAQVRRPWSGPPVVTRK